MTMHVYRRRKGRIAYVFSQRWDLSDGVGIHANKDNTRIYWRGAQS